MTRKTPTGRTLRLIVTRPQPTPSAPAVARKAAA